jgi:hypothetical protein
MYGKISQKNIKFSKGNLLLLYFNAKRQKKKEEMHFFYALPQ